MIWHIAKKEIYHNLMTLRFVLMIILLPVLMVANALIYGFGDGGYREEVNAYNRAMERRLSRVNSDAEESLGRLAMRSVPVRYTSVRVRSNSVRMGLMNSSLTLYR